MITTSNLTFMKIWQEKAAMIDANLADASLILRHAVADKDIYTIEAMESYLSLLDRGKKVRGVLVLIGNELYGDHSSAIAVEAAGAIELCHAHLLVMDDVQDNAETRRSKPAAHRRQSNFIANHSGVRDPEKRGADMVQTAGFAAHFHAMYTLLNLDVPSARSNLAVKLCNKRLFSTGIGQLGDLSPITQTNLTIQNMLQITRDKTAYYTFLLPLEIGAVLAGATSKDIDRFHDYSLNTGLAFQLQDDIMGTFGDPSITGKPHMSDIKEGKKTFLMTKALELASKPDQNTLLSALGNDMLQADHFHQCLDIISQTGALEATRLLATQYAEQAIDALHRDKDPRWPKRSVEFLRALALYSVRRQR